MRILSILFIGGLLLLAGPAKAQLSKEELKQWKKVAKDYARNPEALAELTRERDRYQQEAQQLQERVATLEAEEAQEDNQVAQLQMELNQARNDLMAAQEQVRQMEEQPQEELTARNDGPVMGTVYRVQIGAYEKTRVPENLDSSEDIKLEDAEGMQKVMVGQFANFDEAKQFMDHLQKMGVKGAWIVPYRDGQRITLKEARAAEQQ